MDAPVAVLMAVCNDAGYLPAAVESILAQSRRDFRFLILDDCSTDETPELLSSYARRDSRVEVVRLERNVGQTAALNIGLRRAKSPWIARMDADDYSAPDRLEKQMQAVEETPDVGCLGTAVWEFRDDPSRREAIVRRPLGHEEIRRGALRGAGMIHGTILARREELLGCGGYDERYRYASDREMFIRLFRRVKGRNLPEPLMGLRRHPGQDSYSLKAADEYVEIFERCLAGNGFAGSERAILRRSLAYSYLFRARCRPSAGFWGARAADIGRAFQASPSGCLRGLAGELIQGAKKR